MPLRTLVAVLALKAGATPALPGVELSAEDYRRLYGGAQATATARASITR